MSPISHEFARAAWTQAWQVTALIVIVALATRLLARNRPHLAHVLWLVVLIKCVTPPVFSSTGGIFCWMQTESSSGSIEVDHTDRPRLQQDPVGWALPTKNEQLSSAEQVPEPWPLPTEPSVAEAVVDRQAPEPVRADNGQWPSTTTMLFGVWAMGTFGILAVGIVRWGICSRRIRRGGCRTDHALDRLMVSLSGRLRLRFPAKLVITESPIGPAVIGLFRRTILLPEMIVREKSAADLEPILAHELIHARRGDTWLGVLQMLAQAVWWFHPLVWWAGRLASREAERCCDEAVLAELNCDPARYARCLLDILQQKSSLKPVAAFPGVRPVEVTSRRMERIMRLGQGSRKYSPWWCWAIMLLAAAVTLPGAALVAGADEDAPKDLTVVNDDVAVEDVVDIDEELLETLPSKLSAAIAGLQPAGVESLATVDVADRRPEPLVSRTYRVGDLLADVRSRFDLDEQEAKDYLLGALPTADLSRDLKDSVQRCTWQGTRLVILATADRHDSLASRLETLRIHGFDQIRIRAYFLRCPSTKSLDTLGIDWMTLPAETSTVDTPKKAIAALVAARDQEQPAPRNRTQTTVQKSFPVTVAILDEKQVTSVLDRFEGDQRGSTLRLSRITLFSGQSGGISDHSQRRFVVGMKDDQPQIRYVPEGTAVKMAAMCRKKGGIRLHCRVTFSGVRAVETVTLADGPGKKPLTLEIPEVATTPFECGVPLHSGDSLLIGKHGMEFKDDDGSPYSLFVLLRATKVVSFQPPKPAAADYHVTTEWH